MGDLLFGLFMCKLDERKFDADDMKAHWQHLMQHAAWANRRILDSFQRIKPVEPQLLRLFAHVLTTERIYLERMRGLDPWPQNFWMDLTLEQCAERLIENQFAYKKFFTELAESDLDVAVRYRNSKGMEFQTPIKDLLTHVALHGSYHRGQIAQALRLAGREPVNTDFITFVRENEKAHKSES
jgi:uncharacterized damage-inducible protein DinB